MLKSAVSIFPLDFLYMINLSRIHSQRGQNGSHEHYMPHRRAVYARLVLHLADAGDDVEGLYEE